jgi:putative hydrolase of the HAD superfamily
VPQARLTGVRAVLFDFGGTLDGDGIHWRSRFRASYARVGLPLSPAAFEHAFAEADSRIAAQPRFADEGLAALLAEQVRQQMDVLAIRDPAVASAVVADVLAQAQACLERSRQLLRRLRQLRLGVVSNFTGALERVCREAGLLPYLDVLVDSARVGVCKPDPEIFRLAVRRLQLPAASCVMVGDSFERDVAPARAAGLRAVWLRGPAPRPCPDPAMPDAIVASLAELPPLLGIHA